jgi:DNA (cytosine-5)-methyltransferase 1
MKVARVIKVGLHRGNPRIWLQGKWLERLGWVRDRRFDVRVTDAGVLLLPAAHGHKKVSASAKAAIIDLNGSDLRTTFPTVPCQALAFVNEQLIAIMAVGGAA